MNIDKRILEVLDRAEQGIPPSKAECVALLDRPAASLEASMLRAVADDVCRRRFGNRGLVLGQIGIQTGACTADCGFCGFARSLNRSETAMMPFDEILACVDGFTASDELHALFLLTTHAFDMERLAAVVGAVRARIPRQMQLVLNVGDFNLTQARALKQAGADGAYHICRLREGIDTGLSPLARKDTLRAIRDAGLDLYYCCEPIGPEHTSEELVEQLFIGVEAGCVQHAAMRRVPVPGSSMEGRGQISELRLAQVVAVVALASLASPETQSIAVHEPSLIGLASGANAIWAETGSNPRDAVNAAQARRGRDVEQCKRMLFEAGF